MKLKWVNTFKGILIILVIFGHATQGIASNQQLSNYQAFENIVTIKSLVYSFHMPAFFLASGFFYTNLKDKTSKKYIKNKIHKLMYPYFIWSFFTALFMQIASGKTNSGQGLIDFLYSPLIPFSQFWYLYVYLFIFLTHLLFNKVFKKNANNKLLFFGIMIYLMNPLLPSIWILKNYSSYLLYYSLGLFMLQIIKDNESLFCRKNNVINSMLVFLLLILFLFITRFNFNHYVWLISSFLGIITVLLLSLGINNLKIEKILGYFGENSLKYYVMHLIPLAATRIILLKIINSNLYLVLFFSFIISILSCYIGIIIIDRLRLNKLFFG